MVFHRVPQSVGNSKDHHGHLSGAGFWDREPDFGKSYTMSPFVCHMQKRVPVTEAESMTLVLGGVRRPWKTGGTFSWDPHAFSLSFPDGLLHQHSKPFISVAGSFYQPGKQQTKP